MNAARPLARLLLVALLLTLAACGWRLRGAGGATLEGVAVFIDASAAQPESQPVVVRALRAAGATLSHAPEQADAVLVLLGETVGQRPVSISADARVQEYELVYSLRYRLESASRQVLLPEEAIQVSEVYQYDSNNVLSTQSRAATVTDRLRQDAVRMLLPRMQSALRRTAQE
jgi:LPS-assembly lipoprotein